MPRPPFQLDCMMRNPWETTLGLLHPDATTQRRVPATSTRRGGVRTSCFRYGEGSAGYLQASYKASPGAGA